MRDVTLYSSASIAGPPSPKLPRIPEPAIVSITPSGVILRILKWALSEKITLSFLSTAIPCGKYKPAPVAGPPSPLNFFLPLPAIVSIDPDWISTLRWCNVNDQQSAVFRLDP